MDIVGNLERIFKLILKEDSIELSKNTELGNLPRKPLLISENSIDSDERRNHLENVLSSTALIMEIFWKQYERRFDVFIEYIFHQTENLFNCAISSKMLRFLSQNFFNIMKLFMDITINHPCDRNVTALTSFYKSNLNEIKLKHKMECDDGSWIIEELTMRLRIISIIYKTINQYNSKEESEIGKESSCIEELVNCISRNDERNLFIQLVCYHSDALMIQTLVEIIPTFIQITKSDELLQLIWEEICYFYSSVNNDVNSRIFIIMCYLSDFYFLTKSKNMMTNIFNNSVYWTLLQNGLINIDSTVRKEALFLTKTSLHFIVENNITFYCYKKELEIRGEEQKSDVRFLLIYWDKGVNFNELKELCVIVEYLEEKQIHIVKPIFSTIEKLLNNIEQHKLDVSWLLIVIERMLSHDNMKIVRQGITYLLKINSSYYYEQYMLKRAIKILLTSLNCTQIYMADLSALLEELQIYFENCSIQENGKEFFKILTEEMCDVQWSSEALFAIAYSLQSVKSKKYWGIEEISHIKKIITTGIANHYTYIKSGMQGYLLLAGINLIDTDNVSLDNADSLLCCYHRKISLQRKTELWNHVVKWLRKCYRVEDAQRFLISGMGKRNIGRMVVLLYDTFSDDKTFLEDIKHFLKKICSTFIDIHARPYCDKQIEESYLSVICDIIEESSQDCEFSNIFCPIVSDMVLYIKLQLECIYHIRDFQVCKVFMEYLSTMLHYDRQYLTLPNMMKTWFEKIVTSLFPKNYSNRMLPLQEFINMKLLNLIMSYIPCETSTIELYLKRELNGSLIRTKEDATLTKDLQMLWGRMNSEYLSNKWEILSKIDVSPSKVLQVSNTEFISCCFEALDLSGSAVLLPLISVLGKELPLLLNESRLEELIDAVWRMVMERKKNEEFHSLIKHFVEAVFQLEVIRNGNGQIGRVLVDYSRLILSEKLTAAAITLLKHMQKIGYHEEGKYLFGDFLPRGLLFGPMLKRDERLIRDVCFIIEKSGLSPLSNDFSTGNEVRARSVQIVLTLNSRNEADSRFCESLVEILKVLEEGNSKNKTRYFSDSFVHRVKQRLLQALLVLEPYLMKECADKLWDWLLQKILLENNQPSVRYLQEWLMLRILYRSPSLLSSLWTYFDEGFEKRTCSLCSLISIIYHSVKCIPRDEVADLIETAVQTFLPYCMAQHFSVRLYAQVALSKLLRTAEMLCLKEIIGKYGTVMKSLNKSIEKGNAIKNFIKMKEDFYFTVFDPVEHYSLQTIFFELPRLTNVNKDELIAEDAFARSGIVTKEPVVPLLNKADSLEKFACSKWLFEGSKQDNFMEDIEEREEPRSLNIQKKMIPVKCLMPDREELFQSVSFSSKKTDKDGLVVVASLIDRIPNLGGLSRTCEVFGASELVIGSLKYVEDKQFQSLSVTAEKWITITEVKPFYLSGYLMEMKQNGYTVLAAEQTMNSKSLQSVIFPKKSLLLLGNEKEGIPPTLLPLMDICIEIPQIGIIRSLNVHVTGALFAWEYAKQHRFSSLIP